MAGDAVVDDPFEVELERVVRRLRSGAALPGHARDLVIALIERMTDGVLTHRLEDASPALLADVLLAVAHDEVPAEARRRPGSGAELARIRRAA